MRYASIFENKQECHQVKFKQLYTQVANLYKDKILISSVTRYKPNPSYSLRAPTPPPALSDEDSSSEDEVKVSGDMDELYLTGWS